MTAGYCLPNVPNYQLSTCLCTWVICFPVTIARFTAAGVPRIIATERTYRLACRSMVALLVLSQLFLSSDTAALKMWSTKSCSCHSFPPPPLISCLFGRCVFCNLVSTCSSGVRCGACEPHETQLTLLILPVLENSGSELVLFINVINSSIAILLKDHTVDVVHVGVPKDYIYLNLLCLSYIGNILSHHSFLGQLNFILNIVTIPFTIILLCLVPGRKCSSNALSLLFRGFRFHYRPRCRVSCQICHGFHHLSTRMPRQYVDSSVSCDVWRCQFLYRSI